MRFRIASKDNRESFLDAWWELDESSFDSFHKRSRGDGKNMIIDLFDRNPESVKRILGIAGFSQI